MQKNQRKNLLLLFLQLEFAYMSMLYTILASSMSMVAMREVRKGGSVPKTSRQFALIKENRKGLYKRSSLFRTPDDSLP